METKPFNDTSYEQFLNEYKIMGSRCGRCGAMALPPRPICIACDGREMEWMEFKGRGKLAAFTSISIAPPSMAKEGFNRNNPYLVGVVELDEGVRTVARIIGMDAKKPEAIKVGASLKAEFLQKGDGAHQQTVLAFTFE